MTQNRLKLIFATLALVGALVSVNQTPAMAEGCQDFISQNPTRSFPNAALTHVANTPTANFQLAQNDTILGIWTADQDPSNRTGVHCHILNINEQIGPRRFTAILDTSFVGGQSRQACDVTIFTATVSIICDFVSSTAPYIDDNFTLTLNGDRMTGMNEDDAGVTGMVNFCLART